MPLYDYQCKNCSLIESIIHPIKDNPKIKCKKCGGETKRIITSAPNVIGCKNVPNQAPNKGKKKIPKIDEAKNKKVYGYICECGEKEEIHSYKPEDNRKCPKCKKKMGRDYSGTHMVRNNKDRTVGDYRKMIRETALGK